MHGAQRKKKLNTHEHAKTARHWLEEEPVLLPKALCPHALERTTICWLLKPYRQKTVRIQTDMPQDF